MAATALLEMAATPPAEPVAASAQAAQVVRAEMLRTPVMVAAAATLLVLVWDLALALEAVLEMAATAATVQPEPAARQQLATPRLVTVMVEVPLLAAATAGLPSAAHGPMESAVTATAAGPSAGTAETAQTAA
jgi:hypothetical protein